MERRSGRRRPGPRCRSWTNPDERAPVSDEPRFYDVLMDLSRRAFERRQVEVAFHALSAAAHAAEDDGRMDDLEEVEQTARERLRWLDANHPKHRFSTESA